MARFKTFRSALALVACIALILALGCSSDSGDGADSDDEVRKAPDAKTPDEPRSESSPKETDTTVGKETAPPADVAQVKSEPSQPEQPSEPELKISVAELAMAYQDDPNAAKETYEGKVIELEGLVSDETEQGFDGQFSAMLGVRDDDGDLETKAACRVNESEIATAKMLWGGNTVKVVGKCLGYDFAVAMAECRIVDAGAPVEFMDVTAQEVLDAFAADEQAANEGYAGKNLRITGVVAAYDKSVETFQVVGENESSDKPIYFFLNYPRIHKYKMAEIADGKPVTLEIICGEKHSLSRQVIIDFWRVAKDS